MEAISIVDVPVIVALIRSAYKDNKTIAPLMYQRVTGAFTEKEDGQLATDIFFWSNYLEKLSVSASGIWYSGADTNGELKRILATDGWDDLKAKLNNLIGYPHHN